MAVGSQLRGWLVADGAGATPGVWFRGHDGRTLFLLLLLEPILKGARKDTNEAEGIQRLSLSQRWPRQARTPHPTPTLLVKFSVQPSVQGFQST